MIFCLRSKRTEAIGLKRRKVYCDLRFGRFQSAGPVGLVISGPLAWARYLMVLMSTHGRDRTAKQTAHFMPGIQTRENRKYLGVILPGTLNFSQVLPLRGSTISWLYQAGNQGQPLGNIPDSNHSITLQFAFISKQSLRAGSDIKTSAIQKWRPTRVWSTEPT